MNHEGGFTRQYRRMWDHPVFRSYQEAAVFSWMKDVAQWRETTIRTKFGPVKLGIGEFLMAERTTAEAFGLHRNSLRALIRRMLDDGMISEIQDRCPQRAGTAYRINNYEEYQGISDGSVPEEDRKRTANGTGAGPEEDRKRTKNNEENEVKEKKEGRGCDLTVAAPDQPSESSLAVGQPANDNPPEKPAKQKRGTRVPDGELPEEWAVEANHTREKAGMPLLGRRALAVRWEAFQDYWRGVTGSKGLKADWLATWRNDCRDPRTEKRFPPAPAANANGPPGVKPRPQLADVLKDGKY